MHRTVGEVHRAGGTLKEAFDATHAALAPQYGPGRSSSTACPSTCPGLGRVPGIERPVIWTAERDRAVWDQLQG